jgi:hypothetical protein
MENWIRFAVIIPDLLIAGRTNIKIMEQDPNQPDKNKKPLWPWVLAQFLPSIVIPSVLFTIRPTQRSFDPVWLLILTYIYGVMFSYCYFRVRKNKNIIHSILFSIGAAILVVGLNIILLVSILFVGCLFAIGSGALH